MCAAWDDAGGNAGDDLILGRGLYGCGGRGRRVSDEDDAGQIGAQGCDQHEFRLRVWWHPALIGYLWIDGQVGSEDDRHRAIAVAASSVGDQHNVALTAGEAFIHHLLDVSRLPVIERHGLHPRGRLGCLVVVIVAIVVVVSLWKTPLHPILTNLLPSHVPRQ